MYLRTKQESALTTSKRRTLLPTWTLLVREVVRFYRQPTRVVGALATPIVFWLILGFGLGRSFQSTMNTTGTGYLEYFFPGTILMILLFTSIYSTISIIEDRQEGFLQSVLVAPVSRASIVLGKMLGATAIAVAQGMLFLLFAPLTGMNVALSSILPMFALFTLISFGLTGLGFFIAWKLESTQGFHGIMNVLLFPMWLLSGAAFPASGAPKVVGWLMELNPLTYGLSMIRRLLYSGQSLQLAELPSYTLSLAVSFAFALTLFAVSLRAVSRKRERFA